MCNAHKINRSPNHKPARIWSTNLVDKCDMCGNPFKGGIMYDCAVAPAPNVQAVWGNVCNSCFHIFGGSLGIGRGQMYVLTQALEIGKKDTPAAWIGVLGFDE